MTLFGMSALAFWLGASGLAAGLALLHLLRVRLRTVDVDTLLFFRLAGALQRPRVLPGRPARLLAYLLALAALLLAWLVLAAPRSGLAAASRFVVVDPGAGFGAAAELGTERLLACEELRRSGLGPRGAIYAATLPPTLLYAAGEAGGLLRARAAAMPVAHGGTAAAAAACATVAALAQPDDELCWLGAAAAPVGPLFRHVQFGRPVAGELLRAEWRSVVGGQYALLLQLAGPAQELSLVVDGAVLASATAAAGFGELALGPLALPATPAAIELRGAAWTAPLRLPAPAQRPAKVAIDGLPEELAQAVTAVVSAEAVLELAPTASAADLLVAAADDAADPRPRLLLLPGDAAAPRRAVVAAGSPVALSLRDQRRRSATALSASPAATVWVADAEQGSPLVQAVSPSRLQVVDWLLLPITHADVPLLLGAALRALAGVDPQPLPLAGQPMLVPAGLPVPPATGLLQPVAGVLPLHLEPAAGAALPVAWATGPLPPDLPPATASKAIGGDGVLAPWLLLLLLLLLLLDAILFHRARLP